MAERSDGGLPKLLGGRRAGTVLIAGGLVLAALAWYLVITTTRQAREAAALVAVQASTAGVRQVYAVTAVRDIPQFTPIRADAVAIKAFPEAFAPPGVVSNVDQVVGKFATTTIVRDQLVLNTQVSETRRSINLSASLPPGKVGFWMPLPAMLAQTGGIQPGDRVDILLTIGLTEIRTAGSVPGSPSTAAGATQTSSGMSTQITLQNVEVFFVGSAAGVDLPDSPPPGNGGAGGSGASEPAIPGKGNIAVFLLDPQDALYAKFVKDAGGIIDLVLRPKDVHDPFSTEAVTIDSIVERFRFRVPQNWGAGR